MLYQRFGPASYIFIADLEKRCFLAHYMSYYHNLDMERKNHLNLTKAERKVRYELERDTNKVIKPVNVQSNYQMRTHIN